jgi:hypothetical protein
MMCELLPIWCLAKQTLKFMFFFLSIMIFQACIVHAYANTETFMCCYHILFEHNCRIVAFEAKEHATQMHANHSKSFAKLTMLDLLPIWGFPQIIDNTFCALDNDEGGYIVHPKQIIRQFVYCKHVKHENNC